MARRSGSGFTPEDVEAMYSKRDTIRGSVSAASPDLDPGESIPTAVGHERVWNHHDNQFADDAHDEPRYSNDVADSWLRGAGDGFSDGRKPGFDFGGSWRRADKGDDWNSTTKFDRHAQLASRDRKR